ncbi:hypothetical protein [Streptomyces sp. NBC_00151]|uniref:hypothetical protein n=1 Tax=Streptomyces sp. NBC_00151 TaxID=2975669 RepID=UPI002DDBDFFF|nr:hypothetical protein [Streptomyces sp. NBC_00151]WRZ36651.1 hypothetical protein OG915_00125 [Streptomyces sp. NBC_00151]WRZ44922.1 hypothetical protein OG915_47410 [Streptomyces sp. NBC_00151]
MDWKWTVTAVLPVLTLILGAWLNQLNDRTGKRLNSAEKSDCTHSSASVRNATSVRSSNSPP